MKKNRSMCKNSYKKWFIITISISVVLIVIVGALNIIVDPFFHYHKPITKYRLYNERYINDGIARNFDYDAMIVGNSLSQNFKTSQYDKLFDVNSIKLPYSGAGIQELWQAIGRIVGTPGGSVDEAYEYDAEKWSRNKDKYPPSLGYDHDIREVIVCTDIEDVMRDYSWRRYYEYPTYLYDEDIINDVNYILNMDVLYRGTIYNLLMSMQGRESTSFDEYSSWNRESGPKEACAGLDHIKDPTDTNKREFGEEDRERIYYNILVNINPVIKENPEILFRFVIPPVSVAKWANYRNMGELEYAFDGYEYVLSLLTEYDNVEIYGFDDEYIITEDLDRYCDAIHYDADVNEWMLDEMAKGNHMLTKDNYVRYIEDIKDHYVCYDYSWLSEYCD